MSSPFPSWSPRHIISLNQIFTLIGFLIKICRRELSGLIAFSNGAQNLHFLQEKVGAIIETIVFRIHRGGDLGQQKIFAGNGWCLLAWQKSSLRRNSHSNQHSTQCVLQIQPLLRKNRIIAQRRAWEIGRESGAIVKRDGAKKSTLKSVLVIRFNV